MFGIIDFVVFGIGAFFIITWIILFIIGKRHEDIFDQLNDNDYPLCKVYFVGYALLNIVNYKYLSKRDRKLRKELEVLYDPMYVDYYIRVARSEQITLSLTVLAFSSIAYGFTLSILGFVVVILLGVMLFFFSDTLVEEKISKRSEMMLIDFTDMVSKLALLTNTGMIMREAWKNVSTTGETDLYVEMRNTVTDMENGMSDADAYFKFGNRCMIPEIKKFSSTIIQGLLKGNSELASMLQNQSKEVWADKKQRARRQGEKAAGKLLIPTFIMFGGVMVMIIIPIFTSLGV